MTADDPAAQRAEWTSRPVQRPGDPAPRRIVVCGDVINDVVVRPLGTVAPGSDTAAAITAGPGGSAANQAAWLAHLGAEVVFAGRAGAADADHHRRSLARSGVRAYVAADPEVPTGTIVILVSPDGERTMFTDRGANLRLRRSDVADAVLGDAAVLHLTGYTFFSAPLREVALSLVAQARDRGVAFTLDPGSAAFLARLAPGEFLGWTAGAALCFPNRDEAAVLTEKSVLTGKSVLSGTSQPAAMAAWLAGHYGVVALKLGAEGCVLAVAGEAPVLVPAQPADAQDTTGAGDAFCAAFLSRWVVSPADLTGAAEFAIRVAAAAVTRPGARPPA